MSRHNALHADLKYHSCSFESIFSFGSFCVQRGVNFPPSFHGFTVARWCLSPMPQFIKLAL